MITFDYDNLSASEAVALQQGLKMKINLQLLTKPIKTIAGADISFNKYSPIVYAGIVLLEFPTMRLIEEAAITQEVTFPYIPGLLAFREVPAITSVWQKLKTKPDVIVFDGHGIAHPRKMGIATHFGVVTNTVTIGCAKSILCGKYALLADEQLATADLIYKNEKIGMALRTKKKCNPVFVSPGNKITMQESMEIMKQCVGKYRIPEPTRLAHLLVNRERIASGLA